MLTLAADFFRTLFTVSAGHGRRALRLSSLGVVALVVALALLGMLAKARAEQCLADGRDWRTRVEAHIRTSGAAALALEQRLGVIEQRWQEIQRTDDRHEAYLRAILVGQGKDPDRVVSLAEGVQR